MKTCFLYSRKGKANVHSRKALTFPLLFSIYIYTLHCISFYTVILYFCHFLLSSLLFFTYQYQLHSKIRGLQLQTDRQDVKISKVCINICWLSCFYYIFQEACFMTVCTFVTTDRNAQAANSKDKGFVSTFLLKYHF